MTVLVVTLTSTRSTVLVWLVIGVMVKPRLATVTSTLAVRFLSLLGIVKTRVWAPMGRAAHVKVALRESCSSTAAAPQLPSSACTALALTPGSTLASATATTKLPVPLELHTTAGVTEVLTRAAVSVVMGPATVTVALAAAVAPLPSVTV